MNTISTFVIFAMFGRYLAAPNSLCTESSKTDSDQNETPLDPIVKDQLKVLLAYKYPDYYKKIKQLPCFEEELKKSKYLVDPLWNEISEEIPKSQCDNLSDTAKNNIDPIVKDQLLILISQEMPMFYEKIRGQPCLNQVLIKLKYLVDPLWDEKLNH